MKVSATSVTLTTSASLAPTYVSARGMVREGPQPGELARRQAMQAEPQQVVGLRRAWTRSCSSVSTCPDRNPTNSREACNAPGGAKLAPTSSSSRSSSGRSLSSGRMPSGVASGRMTSSGTTCGCATATPRNACAVRRSAFSQSPPARSGTRSSDRTHVDPTCARHGVQRGQRHLRPGDPHLRAVRLGLRGPMAHHRGARPARDDPTADTLTLARLHGVPSVARHITRSRPVAIARRGEGYSSMSRTTWQERRR